MEYIADKFLLHLGRPKASWKTYQTQCYLYAKQFDHMIFTEDMIDYFAYLLAEKAVKISATGKVVSPCWDSYIQYGTPPFISIGYACELVFLPIRGEYKKD